MELYKAIKEIVASKGSEMINNIQIINFLLHPDNQLLVGLSGFQGKACHKNDSSRCD